MRPVSDNFKSAVYSTTRKTAARVRFEVLDNAAYDDITASTVTSEASISRKDQLTNKSRSMAHRYATFEPDYWLLDGSFHLPPDDGGNEEMGWWSGALCGADRVFSPYQVLQFSFSEQHNSMGMTITFDPMTGECAADFDITVYRGATVVYTLSVTGNDLPKYVLKQGLDNYDKIVVTLKKWAKPYRRVRVTEIDFGVVQDYEGDMLIKVDITEQMAVVGDTLPANEIRFTVDNSSREFNILNPEGFYRFLKERQEVFASLAVEVLPGYFEYVQGGKFYLADWQSNEGALTTTFTARDALDILEQYEYQGLTGATLYSLAEAVLTGAGITSYSIDPALSSIALSQGFPDTVSGRTALQHVGIAGRCAVYQDRDGVLTLKRYSPVSGVTPVDEITFDNVYKEPQIKLDKLLKAITVTVYAGEVKTDYVYTNPGIKEGAAIKCDNPLIQSEAQAAAVAAWIFEEYNSRALYSINWRQNPALECGDVVLVQDSFGASKKSRITKQDYSFQGYLGGKTESKGGV